MGPGPQIDLVLGDLRVGSCLEGVGVISGHVQPRGVIKTIDPILAVGLVTLDGTDVMGFAIVVPRDDLNYINRAAIGDNCLPAFVVQVVVRHINPLKKIVR